MISIKPGRARTRAGCPPQERRNAEGVHLPPSLPTPFPSSSAITLLSSPAASHFVIHQTRPADPFPHLVIRRLDRRIQRNVKTASRLRDDAPTHGKLKTAPSVRGSSTACWIRRSSRRMTRGGGRRSCACPQRLTTDDQSLITDHRSLVTGTDDRRPAAEIRLVTRRPRVGARGRFDWRTIPSSRHPPV